MHPVSIHNWRLIPAYQHFIWLPKCDKDFQFIRIIVSIQSRTSATFVYSPGEPASAQTLPPDTMPIITPAKTSGPPESP